MGPLSNESLFARLSDIPLDPHYALKELFNADTNPRKVILGSGLYRDDNSKPWVLPAVQLAERIVKESQGSDRYEYLPITGYASFVSAARQVLLGPLGFDESRVVSLQTISGTGANSLGARLLAETLKPSAVWLSDPSWVNHANIWNIVGVDVKRYPYWNAKTKQLDLEGMVARLETEANPGDVVLLHACAHNPTGVDPSKEQWVSVAEVCERRGLFPFFDCAYQGFASGDLDEDAWAIRHFLERGKLEVAVAQSFSKNMDLYGERVGALHLFCATQTAAPPVTGARLAATILSKPALFKEWLQDVQEMSGRIKGMRKALYDELVALSTPGKWDHIVSQTGMFSYTGLTPEQVAFAQEVYHVYILKSGRISVSGLTMKNVNYVAKAIDAAVRQHPL